MRFSLCVIANEIGRRSCSKKNLLLRVTPRLLNETLISKETLSMNRLDTSFR